MPKKAITDISTELFALLKPYSPDAASRVGPTQCGDVQEQGVWYRGNLTLRTAFSGAKVRF